MMFKLESKSKLVNLLPYLLLFSASLFPFWMNISTFDPNGLFNLRDADLPFDIVYSFKKMLFTWDPNIGFGYPNFGISKILVFQLPLLFFKKIGFSLLNAEKAYLSLVLFLLGVGAYYFLTNFFNFKNKKVAKISAMAGALFYMFNILTNQRFIGVPHTAIAIAIFPILLVFLERITYLKDVFEAKKYCLLFVLVSPFFLASDMSIAYMFSLIIILVFLLNLLINFRQINLKVVIKRVLLVILGILLINSFWLLPIVGDIFQGNSFITGIVDADHNNQVFRIAKTLSNSPFDILKLHWTKNSFDVVSIAGDYYYPSWIRFYFSLPINTILFFTFLIFGISLSFRNKNNRRQITILTTIGILGFLFSFGQYAPLGFWKFHQFLFQYFPGFQVLRNFLKFQYLQLIWYSSLLMLICYHCLLKYSKKIFLKILIIFVFLVFIFQSALPWFGKNLSGRLEYFVLPEYYYQAREWLGEQKGYFRFVTIPQGSWEETYEWGPKFELVPLYRTFFQQPSLCQEPVDASGAKAFIEPIEDLGVDNLNKYLGFFSIKYILVRKDLTISSISEKDQLLLENIHGYLQGNEYKLVKSFGNKLLFYQTEYEKISPHFFVPQTVIFLDNDEKDIEDIISLEDIRSPIAIFIKDKSSNIANFADEIVLQANNYDSWQIKDNLQLNTSNICLSSISSSPEIQITEINPTRYRIILENPGESFLLVFSESFNKGWKAKVNDNNIRENQHLLVNGYANAWYFKLEDINGGNALVITIQYYLQYLFYLGLGLSTSTAIVCVLLIVKNRKNVHK